jgi:hypothetical protein
LKREAPLAREFWRWLGCTYAATDIDGNPDSIPLDLNVDPVPAGATGRYDLVTNLGTTEHVANQFNAFKVIHDLAAPGGVMITEVPTQGHANHGLFNYTLKFFWMLARSNGYKWLYTDYVIHEKVRLLPVDVLDHIRSLRPETSSSLNGHRISNDLLFISFQKIYDIPFVAPLDVATGSTTKHKAIEERYWTIYKPHSFASLSPWRGD